MGRTVIEHVLHRLKQTGISDVFGVPGDYAFSINDAICTDKDLRWIGNCNELNASYAADGYARIRGMAALCTTYGVGELSAINGLAGSYAEHVPVFSLVGMPPSGVQTARRLVHHTLGNGEFDLFYRMADPVVCARAVMTPENCAAETERLIAAAIEHRRPVYMGFPSDYANMPVIGTTDLLPVPASDPETLEAAAEAICAAVKRSRTACFLAGILVPRLGLNDQATALVDATGLPFATMYMDKCAIGEAHPAYMGMYDGKLLNEEVRAFVEGCDCVINLGALLTDVSTGAFTANLDPRKTIHVMHHHVRVGFAIYNHVEMNDLIEVLTGKTTRRTDIKCPRVHGLGDPQGAAGDRITAEYLYPRWEKMLRPNDILIAETGTTGMGMAFARMPEGATFQNQTLWGSIGWATPAAFGAAFSSPECRTILITGDGSHQLTAQEVSQFPRFGLKPIIFVLNNDGYLIERLLCKDPDIYYNDLAQWNYAALPTALGCEGWFTARVNTCGELDEAINRAETCGTGAYIEVVADKYMASPLSQKMHESIDTLYA